MDNENVTILKPDELIAEIENQGEAIASSMNNQLTTLQLLDGTLLMSFGTNSQLFAAMLGELALQSSAASAQLGEQQLYDAAALEGVSAMYLLLATLSGNVEGIAGNLIALSNSGQGILDNMNQMLPLVQKLGAASEQGDLSKSADAVSGGLGALSNLAGAKGLFTKLGEGSFGGILKGGIGLFSGLLSGPVLPLIIGAITLAVGGFFAFKALKSGIQKENGQESNDNTVTDSGAVNSDSTADNTADEANTNTTSTTSTIDTTQTLVDPFNTGKDDQSQYSQYQSQVESSRNTADALREAVKSGNTEVTTQLQSVADALAKLADKPADRHVNSTITINTLKTNATLLEFKDMLHDVLEREIAVAP